jgi:hypothetical protein
MDSGSRSRRSGQGVFPDIRLDAEMVHHIQLEPHAKGMTGAPLLLLSTKILARPDCSSQRWEFYQCMLALSADVLNHEILGKLLWCSMSRLERSSLWSLTGPGLPPASSWTQPSDTWFRQTLRRLAGYSTPSAS